MQRELVKVSKVLTGSAVAGVAAMSAFAAPVEDAELFHVTRRRDAEAIVRDGLLVNAEPPSQSIASDLAEEEGGAGAMMDTPPDAQAEWRLQELLEDARRSSQTGEKYPTHDGVFFWPSRSAAEQTVEDITFAGAIVGVDPDKLPDHCELATAPTNVPDTIFKQYWDAFREQGGGRFDEQTLFDDAVAWWDDDVHLFEEGVHKSRWEVWTNCNVPPEAITHIEDPTDGRVLYQPTEKDQSTLRDFM